MTRPKAADSQRRPPVAITMHHTGVVVSDLPKAAAYYSRMFGAVPEFELTDVVDAGGRHGVPEARYSLVLMRLPGGRIELVEYHAPRDASKSPAGVRDVGSSHIALTIADLDETIRVLSGLGMKFLGEPMRVTEGPSTGMAIAYGLDPDGNRIEFIQQPIDTPDADGAATHARKHDRRRVRRPGTAS